MKFKIARSIRALAVIALFLGAHKGYSFSTTVNDPGFHHGHFSLVSNAQGFVAAGTRFDLPGSQSDILVIQFDPVGNILWQKIIDIDVEDRCMDVVAGRNGGIALIGITDNNPNDNQNKILLVDMDGSGNVMYTHTYDIQGKAYGFTIEYNPALDHYLLGGATVAPVNLGFVMAVDANSPNNIIWSNNFQSDAFTGVPVNTVNKIIYMPGDGYLVMGGAKLYGYTDQVALLKKIDFNGNELWYIPYDISNLRNLIIDAVIDGTDAYFISNTSVKHTYAVTHVSDINTMSPVLDPFSEAVYFATVQNSQDNAAFGIVQSITDPTQIVVAGMFGVVGSAAGPNSSPLFLSEIDRSGNVLDGSLMDVYNDNYVLTDPMGDVLLKPMDGEGPLLYSPDIIIQNGTIGYYTLTYRFDGSVHNLEVIGTDAKLTSGKTCSSKLTAMAPVQSYNYSSLIVNGTNPKIDNPVGYLDNPTGLNTTNHCPITSCDIELDEEAFTISQRKGCHGTLLTVNITVNSGYPITSYYWNFGGGVTSTAEDPSVLVPPCYDRSFCVTITVATPDGPCSETFCWTNFVNNPIYPPAACGFTCGISPPPFELKKDAIDSKDLSVSMYPNPTDNLLNVEVSDPVDGAVYTMSIISMDGKLVKQLSFASTAFYSVDVSDLTAGLYRVSIHSGADQHHALIVIQ